MITLADEFIASRRCEITINCSINGVVGQFSNNASLLLDDSLCMYISKDDTFSWDDEILKLFTGFQLFLNALFFDELEGMNFFLVSSKDLKVKSCTDIFLSLDRISEFMLKKPSGNSICVEFSLECTSSEPSLRRQFMTSYAWNLNYISHIDLVFEASRILKQ